ncbi:MAG: class I SAM-dependent methyltransferase [Gordonibacter sp.]|uniref:class I SAM-dependent methyltransferase n=1 Tax=Gordonibacter sp. TaxID=1968902 RepID=UPI002FC9F6B1
MPDKPVLDACCGGRMFWFDKADQRAVFMDKRRFVGTCCDGRNVSVEPDVQADFADMPFPDDSFRLVVFDPPHLKCGHNSWTAQKYGRLEGDWRGSIKAGFEECFRVLEPNGVLIFKWNEYQIPVKEILALAPCAPLFGHRSGKKSLTHWIAFIKDERMANA